MESTTPINISISKSSENSPNSYNEFREYVIQNNVQLQKELKENIQQVKELEAAVAEKEVEEDKSDTRLRYMKGLLQNLNELKTDYSKVTQKTEEKFKIINIYNTKFTDEAVKIMIYYHMLLFNLSLLYYFLFSTSVIICVLNAVEFLIICYCATKINTIYQYLLDIELKNKPIIKHLDEEIKEMKKEIKKTEDSTLSLDNWICEM
jgi:hypothetical protein